MAVLPGMEVAVRLFLHALGDFAQYVLPTNEKTGVVFGQFAVVDPGVGWNGGSGYLGQKGFELFIASEGFPVHLVS